MIKYLVVYQVLMCFRVVSENFWHGKYLPTCKTATCRFADAASLGEDFG